MDIAIVLIGLVWIVFSFMLNTKNLRSALLFQVFPFFSGVFAVFYGVYNMGIISVAIPS